MTGFIRVLHELCSECSLVCGMYIIEKINKLLAVIYNVLYVGEERRVLVVSYLKSVIVCCSGRRHAIV